MLRTKTCFIKSSSLRAEAVFPTPPLLCDLYSANCWVLTKPLLEIVNTLSSSGIKSASSIVNLLSMISVLLSSPKFSLISLSSSFTTSTNLDLFERISCNSLICFTSSSYSSFNLSVSSAVSLLSLNSKIAFACTRESLYSFPFRPNPSSNPSGLQISGSATLSNSGLMVDADQFLSQSLSAATLEFSDFFIISITSSILAIATIRPSTMCPLSFA